MKFARIHPIMTEDIAKEGIKSCARPNTYWVRVGVAGSGPLLVSLTFNGVWMNDDNWVS